MILALVTVVLVAFIIVALLVIDPTKDEDDGTVDGFPADRKNHRR